MPFTIYEQYKSPLFMKVPNDDELRAYIAWLEREIATARIQLASREESGLARTVNASPTFVVGPMKVTPEAVKAFNEFKPTPVKLVPQKKPKKAKPKPSTRAE